MKALTQALAALDRGATSNSHLVPTLLRLGLGAVFLAHAYAKLAVFTLPGTALFFEANGLPGWTVYPVLAIELLGGLCFVAGAYVRLAALALLPVMAGALVPHASNGWMFSNPGGGWEYVAVLILALIVQFLLGKDAPPSKREDPDATSGRV
ncbi:MAG: DoxX family protein [Myxococcales bacterium]|nr:MAG: DoxX family protein [Myxococcales bacterium]